ncbi:hypothetical protein MJK72_17690 [Klebsiella pneumoniae]|nr:hypothetical protein MJK72_17690 [Klebsiella pneumoniae]
MALVQRFQFGNNRRLHRCEFTPVLKTRERCAILQPEAVAQNMQTFVVPVIRAAWLKRLAGRVDQVAVSELARQILHNFLGITALFQRGQRFRQSAPHGPAQTENGIPRMVPLRALRAQPGHNSAGFLLDDRFRSAPRQPYAAARLALNDVLQIVDAVEVGVSTACRTSGSPSRGTAISTSSIGWLRRAFKRTL